MYSGFVQCCMINVHSYKYRLQVREKPFLEENYKDKSGLNTLYQSLYFFYGQNITL